MAQEWRSILIDSPADKELVELSRDGDSVSGTVYWNKVDCADIKATHWRPTLSDFDEHIARDPVLAEINISVQKELNEIRRWHDIVDIYTKDWPKDAAEVFRALSVKGWAFTLRAAWKPSKGESEIAAVVRAIFNYITDMDNENMEFRNAQSLESARRAKDPTFPPRVGPRVRESQMKLPGE